MSGRIPQQFIDDLLARADIVATVEHSVALQKAGHDYKACCPFHQEKTPSFTVSPAKQFYHCFGCGAHGTAITFLMEYEHLSFVEAVEELARRSGVEVPRDSQSSALPAPHNPDLFQILQRAEQLFMQQLRDQSIADAAVKYLKNRGISGHIAKTYRLGFATAGWDHLRNTLSQQSTSNQALEECGLVIRNDEGRCYDRFRNRIMFPIHDRRGRVVGFGGRVLDDSTPKYLNSPETPVFHKGEQLYGLYEARQALRKIEQLIVVEGYMDVIALAQHDILNCVATLGTAVTREHLSALFRVCAEVIFCFDGDRAGRDAAWRAAQTALPVIEKDRQAKFLFLPDGEDPDTLVRAEGTTQFQARLNQAVPLAEFIGTKLMQDLDMQLVDDKARFVANLNALLKEMPTSAFRTLLLEDLSRQTGISSKILNQHTDRAESKSPAYQTHHAQMHRTPIRQAIAFLVQRPCLASQVANISSLRCIDLPGIPLLIELIEYIQSNPHVTTGGIIEHWRAQPEGKHLAKLAAVELLVPEMGLEAEFVDMIRFLENQHFEQRYVALERKLTLGVQLNAQELDEYKQLLKVRHTANQTH